MGGIMRRCLVAYEVEMAVQTRDAARCARAWAALQDLSDEDWRAIEPDLVDEIAVLCALYDTDETLQ